MFTGCGTALVTPFRSDQSLDEEALRRLVRRQVDAGIDFLVPCGTTGECPTLTQSERMRIVELTLEEARGHVPVVAGAGGYNTAEVIESAREFQSMGVDGILSVTPYYNKPTQEGLYQHYKAIAAATTLPIIVYSVVGRTGVNVEPATIRRLAEIDNIVGIKEASGNIGQMAAIANGVPDSFVVLSGDDAITLPLAALGGQGVISVVSNEIPAEMTRLTHLCLQNNFPGRARTPPKILSADGSQFRRNKSRPGEGGDGAHGSSRACVALAARPAEGRKSGANPRRSRITRTSPANLCCKRKLKRCSISRQANSLRRIGGCSGNSRKR